MARRLGDGNCKSRVGIVAVVRGEGQRKQNDGKKRMLGNSDSDGKKTRKLGDTGGKKRMLDNSGGNKNVAIAMAMSSKLGNSNDNTVGRWRWQGSSVIVMARKRRAGKYIRQ